MTDNTFGPEPDGTILGGYDPMPQVDYRNLPSFGQVPRPDGQDQPYALAAPTYDDPTVDSVPYSPQPDSGIHAWDLDDNAYNILDPVQGQGGRYAKRPPGFTPDLPNLTAWERSPGGQPGTDGSGAVPPPQQSMP